MMLNDEITAAEDLVQVARNTAAGRLERAKRHLHIGRKPLSRYRRFVSATIANAESAIRHCRKMASDLAAHTQAPTDIAQGILASTRESIRLMHAAMDVIDELAGAGCQLSASQGGVARVTETEIPRSCSFCGDTESKLVAGPEANICTTCTRLACGVLGIELSANETE
ncbi:ClpX C4-type zinc finger protein [Sorangium sp. So ce1097]|uniref:ClpX C4-type zinc finger protein n=1 Tax=Sorangium sp. So ce1097 TaxID=3133330 RepID=UPI003F5DA744